MVTVTSSQHSQRNSPTMTIVVDDAAEARYPRNSGKSSGCMPAPLQGLQKLGCLSKRIDYGLGKFGFSEENWK